MQDKQAQALFKEFGYLRSIWVTVLTAPRIALAILEAGRMKRRWPWTPPEGTVKANAQGYRFHVLLGRWAHG